MNAHIIRAMLWKEWHESRAKWVVFLVTFHIPLVLLLAGIAPVTNVSANLAKGGHYDIRYSILVALAVQSFFILTIGLFLISFYATSAVSPEIANKQVFFLFERPVRREAILLLKFLAGAVEVAACMAISIFVTVCVSYIVALVKSSGAESQLLSDEHLRMLSRLAGGILGTSAVAITVYSAAFFLSIVFEKWWAGALAGSIAMLVLLRFAGARIRDWIINVIGMSSDPLKTADYSPFSHLGAPPVLGMILVCSLFYLASQYLFARKEMR
ncbi:MAG: hypothetical protein ACREDR_08685 [Blastocatellia bacterium]